MRVKKKYLFSLNIIIAILFAILFYKNGIGINLIIFELTSISLLLWLNRPLKLNYLTSTIVVSTIITLILSFTIHTNWTIAINYFLFILLVASLSYKSIQCFLFLAVESLQKIFNSQIQLLCRWHKPKSSPIIINFRRIFFFFLLPLIMILLFIGLYSWANPAFYQYFSFIFDGIIEFFKKLDSTILILLFCGFFLANYMFIPAKPQCLYNKDLNADDNLQNNKQIFSDEINSKLKFYNLSAIIILVALNLLLIFNIIVDIDNVIINFTWDGNTLKQFVHEGTYVLLVAIFLSALMALFIFKGKFNHYHKNKFLKILVSVWLFLNIILCLLVFVRNFRYIEYYGLAYKRIALLFFLVLTVVSLFLIIYKILFKKSTYFLLSTTSFATLIIFVISTFLNWDIIISKYNFSHSDNAIVELAFLSKMDNTALPYLIKSEKELEIFKNNQEKLLKINKTSTLRKIRAYYYTPDKYSHTISSRVDDFIEDYESRNFLEWNFADYRTYKFLKEKSN